MFERSVKRGTCAERHQLGMCAQVVPHKVQLMREFFFSGWGGTNTYAAITVWDQECLWIEAVYKKGHRKLCVTAVTCAAFVRIYLSLLKKKKGSLIKQVCYNSKQKWIDIEAFSSWSPLTYIIIVYCIFFCGGFLPSLLTTKRNV